MRNLTASDRSALIKLASSLPEGSPEKKAILAALQGSSKAASGLSDFDYEVTAEARDYLNMVNEIAIYQLRHLIHKGTMMDNPRLKPFIKEIDAKYKEFVSLTDNLAYSFEKELDAARALDRKSQRRR
jgi:hypothetical protein